MIQAISLYRFWGKIRKGKARGRLLNFPTANMALHKKIPEGAYISYAKIGSKKYPAMTFIGGAKTFHETVYQSETYVLNFDTSLYKKWMTIFLLEKIHGNIKFPSTDALIEQMKNDKHITEKYFKEHKSI